MPAKAPPLTTEEATKLLNRTPTLGVIDAGRILGLGRDASRKAARQGEIPTLPGERVSSAWLRKTVGLDRDTAA